MKEINQTTNNELAASEAVSGKESVFLVEYLKSNVEKFRVVNENLSAVLGELVKKLGLDGSGVDVWLLQYISDAMQTFRELIDEVNSTHWKNPEL